MDPAIHSGVPGVVDLSNSELIARPRTRWAHRDARIEQVRAAICVIPYVLCGLVVVCIDDHDETRVVPAFNSPKLLRSVRRVSRR